MQYRNGAIYTKTEKIIKPSIISARNKLKKDYTKHLVDRVTLDGIRHNLTLSRIVYHCFVTRIDLADKDIVILCRDGDALNIRPANLMKATLSDKSIRIVTRGRMESVFKNLSKAQKRKQRKAIVDKISKRVSQYSLKGRRIKTFPSAAAAERQTKIFATAIRETAGRKGYTAGGYVWRFGNEKTVDITSRRFERKIQFRKQYGQKVTQYHFKGHKVAHHNSLQDA